MSWCDSSATCQQHVKFLVFPQMLVLFLNASQDMQTPPARGKIVSDAASDGHFHLLKGLGHCSLFKHKVRESESNYNGVCVALPLCDTDRGMLIETLTRVLHPPH